MSQHTNKAASGPAKPGRPLRANFTAQTMRYAQTAKRRHSRQQQLLTRIQDLFVMKQLKFLRTAPSTALAIALVVTGSAGAYALSNWFNGVVTVREGDAVFSVDLSSCKGNLPPGVESQDRSNVQFKILGNPHISADELERQLLVQCEFDAVASFYRTKYNADVINDNNGILLSTRIGTIKAVGDGSVTIVYTWFGEKREKTFAVPAGAPIYTKGVPGSLADIHAGDHVMFAIKVTLTTPQQEDKPVDAIESVQDLHSLFVTEHDITTAPGASKNGFYPDNNIMPLDHYNRIKK